MTAGVFNLHRVSYCDVQQCSGAFRGEHVLVCPAHTDGEGRKCAYVAMAPTTAATFEPICCVTMATVIPQKVGEGEIVRGGIRSAEGGDGARVTRAKRFAFALHPSPSEFCCLGSTFKVDASERNNGDTG